MVPPKRHDGYFWLMIAGDNLFLQLRRKASGSDELGFACCVCSVDSGMQGHESSGSCFLYWLALVCSWFKISCWYKTKLRLKKKSIKIITNSETNLCEFQYYFNVATLSILVLESFSVVVRWVTVFCPYVLISCIAGDMHSNCICPNLLFVGDSAHQNSGKLRVLFKTNKQNPIQTNQPKNPPPMR